VSVIVGDGVRLGVSLGNSASASLSPSPLISGVSLGWGASAVRFWAIAVLA